MLHHAVIEHEPCSDDYFQHPVEEDAPGMVTHANFYSFFNIFEKLLHSDYTYTTERTPVNFALFTKYIFE